MDMRVFRVPVIDGHPIDLSAEILLHLSDEVAGEGFEVRHFQRVVGRDDEAEMVAVVLAALGEGASIRLFLSRPEQPRLLAVAGHPVAAQIIEMRAERRGARGMPDHTRLDHRAARARGDEPVGLDAGTLAVPEARAVAGNDAAGARHAAACLLRCRKRLGDEGARGLCTRRADAAGTDAELAIIGHGIAPQCAKTRVDTGP